MKAILAMVGLVLALAGCVGPGRAGPGGIDGAGEPRTDEPAAESTAVVPPSWRTESWHDVTLRVPPTWHLGYSPISDRGYVLDCADNATPAAPYVGRPVYGSDMCVRSNPDQVRAPQQEAVWFESPLPVGELTPDVGVPSRTVRVGDQRVTVAVRDADRRDAIVASATVFGAADGNGCASRPAAADQGSLPTEGSGEVRTMGVCAYDPDGRLIWSGQGGRAQGEVFARAFLSAAPVNTPGHASTESDRVVLVLNAKDPAGTGTLDLVYVVRVDASRVTGPGGKQVRLVRALVRPWASQGMRTYVVAGFGSDPTLARYFKPILG